MKIKILSILKTNLFISIACGFCVYGIWLLISGLRLTYGTNDDYTIALALEYGDNNNLFCSYFLTFLIFKLQNIFTEINIFVLMQIILCFISVVIINYSLSRKFSKNMSVIKTILLIAAINFVYIPTVLIMLQYTQMTTILCLSGCLSITYGIFNELRKAVKLFDIIAGSLLVVISSFFRIESFLMCLLIFAIFVGLSFVIVLIKNKNEGSSIKIALLYNYKSYLKLVSIVLAVVMASFSLNILSNQIKMSDAGYQEYNDYNLARQLTVDYAIAPYQGNESFYNSVGIYSQNDLELIGWWQSDGHQYSTEVLNEIAEFSSQPELGLRFSISHLLSLITGKIQAVIPVNDAAAYIVLVITFILLILGTFIMFKMRNRLKYLFPLIVIMLWTGFLSVFGVVESSVMALPLICVVLIIILLFNRYQYMFAYAATLIALALFMYLKFTRISFRATYTFFVPLAVFTLFFTDFSNLRVNILSAKGVKRTIYSALSVLTVLATSFFGTNYFFNDVIVFRQNQDSGFGEYAIANDDKLFVISNFNAPAYKNYSEPIKQPELYADNILMHGTWLIGSSIYNNTLYDNGIEDVYASAIDSEKIRFVFNTESDVSYGVVKNYFDEHYDNDNTNVEMKLEKAFGSYSVFTIVSE